MSRTGGAVGARVAAHRRAVGAGRAVVARVGPLRFRIRARDAQHTRRTPVGPRRPSVAGAVALGAAALG